MFRSLTLAGVVATVCTSPECVSTPMCAFMPKYQLLPFFVCRISGSRWPESFFVELGAAISVASTAVPVRSSSPLCCSKSLTTRSMSAASSWRSSK